MTKSKELQAVDSRFRTHSDFYPKTPNSQYCAFFEDGQHGEANVNLLELRRLYKRAIKKLPAHREYLVDNKWVHESNMGKRRTGGLEIKHIDEKQVRVRPFDAVDTAVIELGDRAYNIFSLYQAYSRDLAGYVSIIGTLQKEGLVTKI